MTEILQWFRDYPLRFKDMAAIFGVNVKTLWTWRKVLGLPVTRSEQIRYSQPNGPTDLKAQALGYRDAQDAVIDLRFSQGLTRDKASEILGVHPVTITRHTPDNLRGLLHNMSEKGREVLSHLRIRNNRRQPPRSDHPWRNSQ